MFPIYIRPVHARHADMKAEILLVNMIHFRSNSFNKHCPDNECSEIRVRATPSYSIFALSALHIVQLYGEHAPSQPTLPTKKTRGHSLRCVARRIVEHRMLILKMSSIKIYVAENNKRKTIKISICLILGS